MRVFHRFFGLFFRIGGSGEEKKPGFIPPSPEIPFPQRMKIFSQGMIKKWRKGRKMG
jgi:hypothetical protein